MIESTGFMPRTPFLEGVIPMKGGRLPVLVSPSVRGEDEVVQNADDPIQGEAEEKQGDRENDEGPGHVSHICCEAFTHDFLLFHVLLGPVRLRDAEMIPERLILRGSLDNYSITKKGSFCQLPTCLQGRTFEHAHGSPKKRLTRMKTNAC